MTLERHPSDESLLRYAAGSLGAGPSLVVAAHLELCAACRAQVTKFEATWWRFPCGHGTGADAGRCARASVGKT